MKFVDENRIPDQPYPELRGVLSNFEDEVAEELGRNLVGIYLVGSIAIGDFDLDSDIDFLVVTESELSEKSMRALQEIQIRIHAQDCYPAKHLEGSYINQRDLNDRDTVGKKPLFYFDNGSTRYEFSTHDNQWHVRWVLRERGITLIGPTPDTLVQAIPIHEMLSEIKAALIRCAEGFQNEMDRPLSFWNSRFGQSFFVLTCCRMLHSLNTGTVQSKKAGAEWAKQTVESKWRKVIDQAWNEREGVRFGVKIGQPAEKELLRETLAFMKYGIAEMDHYSLKTGVNP